MELAAHFQDRRPSPLRRERPCLCLAGDAGGEEGSFPAVVVSAGGLPGCGRMRHRLVMGMVLANYPTSSAGHQLSVQHWLWGFEELGWDVWVVESIRSSDFCDADGEPCDIARSLQLANWRRFLQAHHLADRATLFVDGEAHDAEAFRIFADGADLFLNYAGRFDLLDEVRTIDKRVYLDVDPGFTQTWALGYVCDMNFDAHDFHVTIGSAIDERDCRIPPTGHDWIPTLPPISLPYYESAGFRNASARAEGPWSTITHWYGAADVEYDCLVLRGNGRAFFPWRTSLCEPHAEF